MPHDVDAITNSLQGILTETDQVGMLDYYKGFNKMSADKFKSEDGAIRVAWDDHVSVARHVLC
jgi:hypothetical protein